jgi:putative transposase
VRELLDDELVDELLAGARTEQEIVGPGGLLSQLTKRLVERAMDVELTEHLGYEHGQSPPGRRGQHPQRLDTKDAHDRARPGADRHATRSRQQQ